MPLTRTHVTHIDVIGADQHVYLITATSPDGEETYGAMRVDVVDDEAHVNYLEVREEYRRRGVSRVLYEALYDWAEKEGLVVHHGMLTDLGAAALEAFRRSRESIKLKNRLMR